MQRINAKPEAAADLIPDFCHGAALVPLVFVMVLVAIVLTLADFEPGEAVFSRFVLLALYLQWLALTCAAALCLVRRKLGGMSARNVFILCWALLLVVTGAVSEVSWHVAHFVAWPILAGSHGDFVFRNLAISAVVAPLVLRYFWLQNQWRAQTQAEGEARYQALSARIRPHFLFNALNSVAALVATRPAEAEALVEDLSDLFRASLDAQSRLGPLADEIDTVQTYLRIEQVRLGERLRVEWNLPHDLLKLPVPVLALQPLVENAVLHGVSRRRDGGLIRIEARRGPGILVLQVENPIAEDGSSTGGGGTRTALRNIAQRLSLLYGERARIELGRAGDVFRARLILPLDAPEPRTS